MTASVFLVGTKRLLQRTSSIFALLLTVIARNEGRRRLYFELHLFDLSGFKQRSASRTVETDSHIEYSNSNTCIFGIHDKFINYWIIIKVAIICDGSSSTGLVHCLKLTSCESAGPEKQLSESTLLL